MSELSACNCGFMSTLHCGWPRALAIDIGSDVELRVTALLVTDNLAVAASILRYVTSAAGFHRCAGACKPELAHKILSIGLLRAG